MKKIIALLLVVVMAASLVACQTPDAGNTTKNPGTTASKPAATQPSQTNPSEPGKTEGVMTHAEYLATEDGMEVTVEFYVQATQGWWFDSTAGHGKITIYGQSAEGGYFAYEVNCDEETSQKVVPGAKIRVTGEKATWEGEVEIMNGTLEVIEGDTMIAEPVDVTAYVGTDALVNYQNMKVSFKGATVVASTVKDDPNEYVFLYKWNNSGKEGDDLYFNVSIDGKVYTFCVESYLCGLGSEAYEAVRNLQIGDVIDLEGFLYWYNGAQPHITSVAAGKTAHDIYMETEDGMEVSVTFYVQATQGWWFDSTAGHGKITIYGQSAEGGYFAYEVNCDEETSQKVVPGAKIRVTGEKATWEGEVEIMNGTLEVIEGDTMIAEPVDVTAYVGTDALVNYQNMKVSFKGATVVASTVKDDPNEYVFLYKWNNSGKEGDDLYFNVSIDGKVYTFCVESYLCGLGSEAYEAVRNLQIGDVIDLEGFLYWYNGAQPHITSVVKAG